MGSKDTSATAFSPPDTATTPPGFYLYFGHQMITAKPRARVGVGIGCLPATWASSTQLVCLSASTATSAGGVPYVVSISGEHARHPLLPPNPRSNYSFVADPSSGQVAFISQLGNAVDLYRVDALHAGSRPVLVAKLTHVNPLSGPVDVLGWAHTGGS